MAHLSRDADLEGAILDGAYVRALQHAAGAKGGP